MKKLFITLTFVCSLSSHAQTPKPIPVETLFAPQQTLQTKLGSNDRGTVTREGKQWHITGQAPLTVVLVPTEGTAWDISAYRLISVKVLNNDAGITTINGKLNNSKATGWSRHAQGFAVAPSGEMAILGFPFPMLEGEYQGPAVFSDQLAKPSGHRVHWRQFYPKDVRKLVMQIRSSSGTVDLLVDDPQLAWSAAPQLSKQLEAMPYLDKLGQVRAVTWPGKITAPKALGQALWKEFGEAEKAAKSNKLWGRYGGWAKGPKHEATGHFRTQKIDGRWWLIDPDGYLFFSVGVCLAGHSSATKVNPARREANFFAYLPGDDDYLRWAGLKKQGGQQMVDFPTINIQRSFGDNWKKHVRNATHNRMRAFGLNTLGSWSDPALHQDQRTPYTLIGSIWWQPSGHKKFPSPFRKDFEADIRKALEKHAAAKDDPYCLGIFLGNELEWPDQFTPKVFELPEADATKGWVRDQLGEKYGDIAALNTKWKTKYGQWGEVLTGNHIPEAARKDIEPMYLDFTTTYFRRTKQAIEAVLPNKLYLGCRTHRGPNVLGRGAAGHADVFSVNIYDSEVRHWQVPDDVDMPILVGEFHFGAVDRGVPSPGLSGCWNQRQRGYAFSRYLASALANPRMVGVHWFQWIDQSAAGRPDRENHQVGFIDVTGRAYPEFTEIVSRSTLQLYPARLSSPAKAETEVVLEKLLSH